MGLHLSYPSDNLDELRAALRADAAAIATALLGQPNKAASSRQELRWGSKGSFRVWIAGPKRGGWADFSGDGKGDLLALIRHVRGGGFPDAVAWARQWTGIGADADGAQDRQPVQPRQPPPERDRTAEEAEAAAERASRVRVARRIAAEAVSIAGTLGEIYLRQTRGIARPPAGWPDAIRWHAGYCAVVAVATSAAGMVEAVQRVHLAKTAEKLGPEELRQRRLTSAKLTNGVVADGAVVRLPGNATGPLLIAEGPETGLAVHAATGHETWIALGSVARVQAPAGRRVVVVADDNPKASDARHGQAAKALANAINGWRAAGVNLVVATPWAVRRWDRSDFADLGLHHGADAVRARIEAALAPAVDAAKRVSAVEARKLVAEAVGAFFRKVDDLSLTRAEWLDTAAAFMEGKSPAGRSPGGDQEADWGAALDAPIIPPADKLFTHGVRVDVGVGKSHEARHWIAWLLAEMRARGDKRCVALAVPQHALSNEQAARFRELAIVQEAGLQVAIWRGYGADDPEQPGETMCQRLEAVHDAQAVGLSAQTSCCRRRVVQADGTKATMFCPLYEACGYQRQMRRKADLWIVAADSLWHEKPAAIGELAAVVVDEGAWRKGLIGAEGRHLDLPLDAIEAETGKGGLWDARLRDLRRQLAETVRRLPDGPVSRDVLLGLGDLEDEDAPIPTTLEAKSAAEAVVLEYARLVDPLHPGQTREQRREAMQAAEGNKTVPRLVMVWNALRVLLSPGAPSASGWLSIVTETTPDGPVRMLRMKGRRDVREGWKAPTLLLDALLPIDLAQAFWPDLELVADVKAEVPHQRVRQVVDRAYSLSMLAQMDDPEEGGAEARRRVNRLHDLRAVLIREARHYAPGRVLAVMQKRVRESLEDLGRLPSNLVLAHHNNVAGRDEWRDVAALIVVGRTLPSPSGVERISEALTGQAVRPLAGWYERSDAVREMVDGSLIPTEADRHPGSLAESIRWQTCEGELLQIIGRARGVNRTAANPVDVLVLTDVPLPVPLTGTLNSAELAPGPADHMMAAGGMVLTNARHAATIFRELWATPNAADLAMRRSPSFPYIEYILGNDGLLARVNYQLAGRGSKSVVAWAALDLCPDPCAFLTAHLGELAWCRIEGEECPPEPPPGPGRRRSRPSDGVDGPAPEASRPAVLGEASMQLVEDADGRASPESSRRREGGDQPGDGETSRRHEVGWAIPLPSGPTCDAPWLHVPALAVRVDSATVEVSSCPYCGERHLHHGFGHRLAHCAQPDGRGYVLRSRIGGS